MGEGNTHRKPAKEPSVSQFLSDYKNSKKIEFASNRRRVKTYDSELVVTP